MDSVDRDRGLMVADQQPVAFLSPADNRLPVIAALEEICASSGPGARIPSHLELMSQLNASERVVRFALKHLQQAGKLVRRQGAGTFVARVDRGKSVTPMPANKSSRGTVILVAEVGSAYLERCLDLLYCQAELDNHAVICCPVRRENQLAFQVPGTDSAGIIVLTSGLYPLAQRLHSDAHRVVLMGTPPVSVRPTLPCVHADHEHGGYVAAKHLIALGHRRIAFLHATSDITDTKRWAGHQAALREARENGIPVEDALYLKDKMDAWREDPRRAAQDLRAVGAPTGMVFWNDQLAMTFLSVLQNAGVRVPEEVSLVGYDDLPEGEQIYPQLTTVNHGLGQQIRTAVGILTDAATDSALYRVQVIPTLIPRASSAKMPQMIEVRAER